MVGDLEELGESVSVRLASGILNHFARPVVGQTVDNLTTGDTDFIGNFLCGDGFASIGQSLDNFIVDIRIHGTISIGFRLTLGEFGVQFRTDFIRFGSVDGGNEGQDGVHGRFLHSEYLSGLWSVLLLFSVPLVSLGTIIVYHIFRKTQVPYLDVQHLRILGIKN